MGNSEQMTGPAEWMRDVPDGADQNAGTVLKLLHAVRIQLGMEVAWTSEFVDSQQFFRFVDAQAGAPAPTVGSSSPLSGSYCARVLDGRMPAINRDARHAPETALLDVTRELQIGSYLGVPLLGVDGTVSGMLCAISRTATPSLSERDLHTLRLLAELLHDVQVRALDDAAVRRLREQLLSDLHRAIEGHGRWPVVQPIFDARTGTLVALEGLSRFDSERTPARWFDAAARAGLSAELELAAAESVLDLLRDGRTVPDGVAVSVNLSPATALNADLAALLHGVDLARVIVEITEHHPVSDYAGFCAFLAPWRARGLRLAVDDAGAGYASLQHVLMCEPDWIKLDIALIRGVDVDPVRKALLRAVIAFAVEAGIKVVAEGVETEPERDALCELGVDLLQGFLLGHPAKPQP